LALAGYLPPPIPPNFFAFVVVQVNVHHDFLFPQPLINVRSEYVTLD
jgi:hypothetical protein